MRIQLLGTGGYFPNDRRHTACILIPELELMLDAGSAAFRAPPNLQSPELDIYLTHAHLDHVCGLTELLVPLTFGTLNAIRVHGRPDVLESLREHLFAPALFPVMPEYEWKPLDGDHANLKSGATLRWQTLKSHPGWSLGYRLDWQGDGETPRSLAYITDTCVDGSYSEFIRGVDLLIHECYFPDAAADFAQVTGHSCLSQVLDLARECNVGRLVLTHVDPCAASADPVGLAEGRDRFPNTEIAVDGLEIEL